MVVSWDEWLFFLFFMVPPKNTKYNDKIGTSHSLLFPPYNGAQNFSAAPVFKDTERGHKGNKSGLWDRQLVCF